MAKTKKASKKAGTKQAGKKGAARTQVKHPSRKHATAANIAPVRHMKDRRGRLHVIQENLPSGLVAKPAMAQPNSKHRSYFEFVENTEKKKKLEFTVTNKREPPPGYEFVPIGNPALTAACKELSREQEAMIFIVSTYSEEHVKVPELGVALNRVGHHIRESIVEQARESLGEMEGIVQQAPLDVPEPIPEDQEEINKQADATIRDLFPRIPNTDRQIIIEHSFKKGARGFDGMPLVGLASNLTLSRRVQLAVVSHIRHTHTRYDQLLRETTWANARRAVEELCLDILVKWRGDEESGRDQLDEILREVVVISDSEDDYEDDDDDEDEDDEDEDEDADGEDTDMTSGDSGDETDASTGDRPPVAEHQALASGSRRPHADPAAAMARRPPVDEPTEAERAKAAAIKAHRGFQRYQAARNHAWEQAVSRQRPGHGHAPFASRPAAISRPEREGSHVFRGGQDPGTHYQSYRADRGDGTGLSDPHAQHQRHHPEALRVNPGPAVPPQARPPAAYYHDRDQDYRDGDGAGNASGPIVGLHHGFGSPPGLRTVISRPIPEDLKDYLVPSIEPNSPLASRFQAQTLEDRRLDQSSEHWQSRPALHHGDVDPRYASSQIPAEGFIRVYRQARDQGRSEPMPHPPSRPGAFGTREDGPVRPEMQGPDMHRPVTVANPSYRHSPGDFLSRNDSVRADVPSSRQERPRFTLAEEPRGAYGAAPEPRWQPAVSDGSNGRYADAMRPLIVEDTRMRGEPYRSYMAPVPDDGNSARYRDAARPIVVEDTHTWRDPHRPAPAQFRVAQAPAPVLVRGPVFGTQDFIPVSNMFPRPHAATGYEQRYLYDMPDTRANLPRQERVVRYEYVEHERADERQVQRVHDRGEALRAPDPSAGPAGSATYGAPPASRPSGHDRVIYLE